MSGADLPPKFNPSDPTPPTDPQFLESQETSAALSPESQTPDQIDSKDDDWETVNLPHAISLDQLPVVEDTTPEEKRHPLEKLTSTELEVKLGESENLSPLIQALHECNRDLINRVTELETELDECRQTLNDQNHLLNQRNQDLAFAQDQVSRLFGKLELSNQVIRRQQVLVETLTEQWETSQTRMAQMERECAIAQQRYNEQFHELVQTQSACRELRSRLHRQQRHTLQFKAALERCLEMQPRLENVSQNEEAKTGLDLPNFESISSTENSDESVEFEPYPYQPGVTRSQPVKPWSAEFLTEDESLDRLDEMVKQNPHDFNEELVDEWLELDEETSSTLQESSQVLPQLNLRDHSEQNVEDSQFSEPINLEELTLNPFNEDEFSSVESSQKPPSPRFIDEELDRIRIEYASSTLPSFDLQTGNSGFVSLPHHPLDQLHRGSDQPEQRVSTGKTPNWPAPLIQPTRPKKLRSLASIQLPRFPEVASVEKAVIASKNEAEPF